MKTTPSNLIQARHRHAVWLPTIWTATIGLGLLLVIGSLWQPADAGLRIQLWSEALLLVALIAVLVRLRASHSHHTVARSLDSKLGSYNRLEASAELAERTDALAQAQRSDTANFLADNHPPAAWPWSLGLACCFLFVLVHLVNLGLTSYHHFTAINAITTLAKSATKPAKDAIAKNEPPPATLRWISPNPETTGTPIEEIPLTAEAESTTGLKDVSLIVTVNGEERPAVPVPATVAAGRQPLALSIYLDELNVQPFDMVSYYLRANRVEPAGAAPATPWPAVTSPLQFLQVRPLRDDTRLAKDPPGPPKPGSPNQMLNVVKNLKLVQIELMRDAFSLANDNPPHTDPGWPGLNQTAGFAQSSLAMKTNEAIDLATQGGAPAEVVNDLTQAKTQMTIAANRLMITKPSEAAPNQGHALAELTAIEKYFVKVLQQNSGQGQSPPPDPFKVAQPYKLPPREETPAGQLERLAREQGQLADKLASSTSHPPPSPASSPSSSPSSSPGSSAGSPPGSAPGASPGSNGGSPPGSSPGSSAGTPSNISAQQQKLADDINHLANAGTLPAEAGSALHDAAASSRAAATQLAANDPVAAAEPAAQAAINLRDALAKVKAASNADAGNVLANAQRALNQSAGDVAGANPDTSKTAATDAAQSTAQVQDLLRNAAQKQQAAGSQEAAKQLADLANAIASSRVQDDLKNLADNGPAASDADRLAVANKLLALAQGAANGQGAVGDRDALAAQARDALKRDRVNLDRADQAGQDALRGLHDDVMAQAQIAVAAAQGDGKRVDDPVLGPITMLAPPPPPPDNAQHKPFMRMMGSQIDALIKMLGEQNASGRPQVLATAQASEAPPAYRAAVADYFESLAHEHDPTPAQP